MVTSVFIIVQLIVFCVLGWILNKRHHLLRAGKVLTICLFVKPLMAGTFARVVMILTAIFFLLMLLVSVSSPKLAAASRGLCGPFLFSRENVVVAVEWSILFPIIGTVITRFLLFSIFLMARMSMGLIQRIMKNSNLLVGKVLFSFLC